MTFQGVIVSMVPKFLQHEPLFWILVSQIFCFLIFPFGCHTDTSNWTFSNGTLDFPQSSSSSSSPSHKCHHSLPNSTGKTPENSGDHRFLLHPAQTQLQFHWLYPKHVLTSAPSRHRALAMLVHGNNLSASTLALPLSTLHTWVIFKI